MIYELQVLGQARVRRNKGARRRLLKLRLLAADPFCYWCRHPLTWKTGTLDHIFPRCRGGRATTQNLVLACKSCNWTKRGRTPDEWRADLLRGALFAGFKVVAVESDD